MSAGRFRKIALSLPEAIEGAHQGHADFRVGKRIFATLGYPDDAWGMVKLTAEQQTMLVEAEPDIFRPVPGRWGKGGSTNVRLAKANPETLRSALAMAWRNVAPKSLVKPQETQRLNSAPHQTPRAQYLSMHRRPLSGLIASIVRIATPPKERATTMVRSAGGSHAKARASLVAGDDGRARQRGARVRQRTV